jgi:hypothetical protein
MNRDMWNRIKGCLVLLVAASLAVVLTGCEGQGDTPGEEVPITGDSTLTVHVSDYDTTVYFDGQYIGTVQEDATRSWQVPSGTHELHFDNAEINNSEAHEATVTLVSGQELSYSVWWMSF